MYYFVNKEVYNQICTCPFILIFVCAHFCNKIERCQLWKSLKYFDILRPMKNVSDLNIPDENMSDFVSFLFFGYTSVTKLKNVDSKSHWNSYFLLSKKEYVRFEYVLSNSIWFGLIFVVWILNFGNKLENTDFELYWNRIIFFN